MTAGVAGRAISGSEKALMFALSGLARSGATRSNYISLRALISIGGIWTGPAAPRRVLIASLTIHDLLNETPNTCTFTVQGARPVEGAELTITLGSINNPHKLFGGHILRVTEIYVGQNPANVLWQVEGIDYTWQLNGRLVNGRYTAQTGHAIAQNLFTKYGLPGYGIYFRNALPTIDEISMTNVPFMEAMTQIATRVGAHATVTYGKGIVFWLPELSTSDAAPPPPPLTSDHPTLEEITYTRDLSQIVTRAIVEGGGANALADVAPGETRLPVEDTAWYQAGGGRVVSGPQRLTYTGIVEGGAGALIGPTAQPASAPTLTPQAGTGLGAGIYKYAFTWQSGTGETVPSPIATVSTAGIPNPTVAPGAGFQGDPYNGGLVPGGHYRFKYGYATNTLRPPDPGAALTLASPSVGITASPAGYAAITVPYPTNPAVCRIFVFRTTNNGGIYYYDSEWNVTSGWGGPPLTQGSTLPDALLDDNWREPSSNTTAMQTGQVLVSGIATGPSGTTNRKVYRSTVNGSALLLLTTLAGNSATALAGPDAAADGTLGAAAPSTDTAGLSSGSGQVLAGASAMLLSSAAAFGTQGWARVGGAQTIRYSSVIGSTLTGIPALGPGSLGATVQYGTEVLVAPQLVGIPAAGSGAITLAITQGEAVNLLVMIDDAAAQAALAALTGGDGIVESALQDNRISQAEANSRATALLAQKKHPQETVRYRCRDPHTRSGATITVNLPVPVGIAGTFQIQDVTISRFMGTNHYPTFDAVASSARFTFEDLLRQVRTRVRSQPA